MIAVLGPKGSYTDIARRKITEETPLFCQSISECLEAVKNRRAERALVPIENSVGGTVHETVTGIVNSDLFITGEISMKILHSLCTAGNFDEIYSHPQAFSQCRRYLERNYPNAELIACASTSEAALKAKKFGQAAVCHPETGKIYGLKVVETEIQDSDNNTTRFVMVSKTPSKGEKTTIVFTCEDRPGALWEILGEFAKRGVNLTKIESRPTGRFLGDYFFILDIQGSSESDPVSKALEGVKKKAVMFRVLGCYPLLGEF